jgi:hypothetical protein
MKKILIMFFLLSSLSCFAQEKIIDFSQLEAWIAFHKMQYQNMKDVKENDAQISAVSTQIEAKITQIRNLEEKFHNSLVKVNSYLNLCGDAVYIAETINDIWKYQREAATLAKGDAELLLIMGQAEIELGKRIAKLIAYSILSVTETDITLMTTEKRDRLVKYVIDELRTMRGLSYLVKCKVEWAIRFGKKKYVNQALEALYAEYGKKHTEIAEKVLDKTLNKIK